MAARRRRGRSSFRKKKQNVEWSNNSVVTPVAITAASQFIELVPDGMSGAVIAADFTLKRIVGSFSISPQSAATATSTMGLAIFRSLHNEGGTRLTDVSPLSTDADAGSQDILWQKQFQPEFGGPLDATGLDFAFDLQIDIKARGSLRKLDKRNGIFLVHRAETTARLQFTFKFRILTGLDR